MLNSITAYCKPKALDISSTNMSNAFGLLMLDKIRQQIQVRIQHILLALHMYN